MPSSLHSTPLNKPQSSHSTPIDKPPSKPIPTSITKPASLDSTFITKPSTSSFTPIPAHTLSLHERRRSGSPCNKIVDSWNMKSVLSHNSVRTPSNSRLPNTPLHTPVMSNTPLRTPKSIPRRKVIISDDRILGTPDYLAPELLLRKGHGFGVDWWALGVCLYEFMTGIPPFTGETPEEIFSNILTRDIAWPEGDEELSPSAVLAVELLLTLDPNKRPTAPDIKLMALFRDLFEYDLLNLEAPFIPAPEEPTDTCYFQARNEAQNLKLSTLEL